MSAFNKTLYTAKLNAHLYGQVEKNRKEAEFVHRARKEREPS